MPTTPNGPALLACCTAAPQVPQVRASSSAAAAAQEFVCTHGERVRRLGDMQLEQRLRDRKRGCVRSAAFSWVGRREVVLQ